MDMFNPLLEQEELVPTTFTWRSGGQTVCIAGTWTDWVSIPMEKQGDNIWTKTVDLAPAIYAYKYIVDGVWRCSDDQQTIKDPQGNVNNVISVAVPERESSDEENGSPDVEAPILNYRRRMVPTKWTPMDYEWTELGSSPRNKPLKNQFLLSGVYGGSDDTTMQLFNRKLLLVMVGLPARGKSFISRKLARYLSWLGYKTKVFNLGNYRREKYGSQHRHDFFSPENSDSVHVRNAIAEEALDDLFGWFRQGGNVAIYDGTNSTHERRNMIISKVKANKKSVPGSIKTIFVEVICNDPRIIESNIRATKLKSPDYIGVDPDKATEDFRSRIAHYERTYETVSDDHSYIKIFDVGRQVVINRIHGFLPSKMVLFLNNLHIIPRPIYLVRHGETTDNELGNLGGDAPLTEKGEQFAKELKKFMDSPPLDQDEIQATQNPADLSLWVSTAKRSIETANPVKCCQLVRWRALDPISVGALDGMTEASFQQQCPEEFKNRQKNKLGYRYPRGENYEDVIRRLEPVIIELERQRKPVLIVAHRSVLRCLIAYFKDIPQDEIPHIQVPLHTVIKLYPAAYGTLEKQYKLGPTTTSAASDHTMT